MMERIILLWYDNTQLPIILLYVFSELNYILINLNVYFYISKTNDFSVDILRCRSIDHHIKLIRSYK